MIGDAISILPEYIATYQPIAEQILDKCSKYPKIVVLIGGESGSGKSVLATCLSEIFRHQHISNVLIQLDDYFKLPPATNQMNREKSLSNVGMHEVNMDVLQQHLDTFKEGESSIQKPLSSHETNTLDQETLQLKNVRILLIEGTYSLFLNGGHYRIFIDRNFKLTKSNRIARSRDIINDFSEKVLAIEHDLVQKSNSNIDCQVRSDYTLAFSKDSSNPQ